MSSRYIDGLGDNDGYTVVRRKRAHGRRITSRGSETESDSERETDQEYSTVHQRRHKTVLATKYVIIMEAVRKDFKLTFIRSSTFAKAIRESIGIVQNIKPLRSGSFAITCTSKEQADRLIETKTICDAEIHCKYPKSLVESKGVINGVHLEETETDLLEELESQKVKAVRRLNRGENKIPTRTVLLTFDTPHLPDKVMFGYRAYPVRPFIPSPVRCFHCQRFNHVKGECRAKQRCVHCGEEHEGEQCSKIATPSCINCGGLHSASDTSCPNYKQAKEIKRVKIEREVTYAQAVRIVQSSATQHPAGKPPHPPVLISSIDINTDCDTSDYQDKPSTRKPKVRKTNIGSTDFTPSRLTSRSTHKPTVANASTQTDSQDMCTQTPGLLDHNTLTLFLACLAEAFSTISPSGKKSDKIKAVVDAANKIFDAAIYGKDISDTIKSRE